MLCVEKVLLLGAASALYQQSPENTIQFIWQTKENQTASQYTKELRATGRSIERQFIHYGCHLQLRGYRQRMRGHLGNNRWREGKEEREVLGGGGMEKDNSFQVMFICAAIQKCRAVYVQQKHEQELAVPTRLKPHFIGDCV